ncbi:MAG TPA: protein kinase family protein [Frankiaceae bacterium]|nr:protein kinase family protein [Frankiaceae bacterium]
MGDGSNRPPSSAVDHEVMATAVPALVTLPPGTVLDARYCLQSVVTRRGPVTLWRGDDRVLARPVAVRVVEHSPGHAAGGTALTTALPDDDPDQAAQRLLRAAVTSGRLVHPGAASTYDATTTATPLGTVSYVVSEWVEGMSLERLLAHGPLRPERAVAILLAVSRVVAAAHARAVHHGDLHPSDVVVTHHGAVKLTDLEIGAAVAEFDGTVPARPGDDELAERDVRGLGALLYAALTGKWPLGRGAGLPAAGRTPDGRLLAPREVRAGVSRELDALTLAALHDPRAAYPVSTAAALVAALDRLAPSDPAFTVAVPTLDDDTPPSLSATDGGDDPPAPPPPPPARRRTRLLPWIVAALVGALVALALFTLPRPKDRTQGGGTSTAPAAAPAPLQVVRPVEVRDFDPQGGDGVEQPSKVPLATDGDPATAWQTETYQRDSHFGNLKQGVGLRVDLGRAVRVREVDLTFLNAGQSLELRAADAPASTDSGYARVASVDDAGTTAQLRPDDPRPHRYWLVWLTNLPAVAGGFQGSIAEMVFRA